jgi:uncharacterized membrane protein
MLLPIDPLHELAIAASLWFLIHPAVAGSGLRAVLAARLGERGFQGFFAVLSLASLSWLCAVYSRAPCAPLWQTPAFAYWLPLAIVPWAFVLAAGAYTVPNPTSAGQEAALGRGEPRGVLRITRHPFLIGVALWSVVHFAINGNVASAWFFGSFFLTATRGALDIDRKRAERDPEAFARYRAQTSIVPFAAILGGRNRLVLRELGLPLALGAVLTAIVVAFHQTWFHVSAIPR